ncbi:MAG: response regulator [Flavobacteriales bacterium]|nr:response regulator [Flavobacteriales bacterium]
MKVLIVEDELLIAKVYSIHFSKSGVQVIATVTHPDDAIEIMKNETPDAIILDVQLKGGADGIGFARLLRKSWNGPIVFTTGNSYIKTNQDISDIPNCFVMTKPVESELLLRKIREMMK